MTEPIRRLRRLRANGAIRRLVADARLSPDRFVLPVFVAEGISEERPLASLPGHHHWPAERIGLIAKEAASLGIPGLLVFGVTGEKDERASRAFAPDGPAQRGIAEAKAAAPDLAVFADTCLCGYTSHGHCGLVRRGVREGSRSRSDALGPASSGEPPEEGLEVLNDETLEVLAAVAVSQADAGADFVSPSDMMDGRVGAIRRALDGAGHPACGILAYSAKFASSMYGPFRDVAGSAPAFGDRRGYQIDPPALRQGLASIERDIAEGADIVMVKPALPYLDLIHAARARIDTPLAAYNVSGEYAMVRAAAERGWLDERRAALEVLTGIVRAGADFVVTYHALDAARWLTAG